MVAIASTNMTLDLMVEDLEALRKELKQETLTLLGHSWGGFLAMAYASAHPRQIDRMVLIAPAGPTQEYLQWFPDNHSARLRTEDKELARYWEMSTERGVDPAKAGLEMLRAVTPGFFFDRSKGLELGAQLTEAMYNHHVNLAIGENLAKGYNLCAGLQKVDRPVLILQGYQDPIGDRTAEQIHRLLRSSSLRYIRRCGHFPWIEQPEEFRKILTEFLSTKLGQPGE